MCSALLPAARNPLGGSCAAVAGEMGCAESATGTALALPTPALAVRLGSSSTPRSEVCRSGGCAAEAKPGRGALEVARSAVAAASEARAEEWVRAEEPPRVAEDEAALCCWRAAAAAWREPGLLELRRRKELFVLE